MPAIHFNLSVCFQSDFKPNKPQCQQMIPNTQVLITHVGRPEGVLSPCILASTWPRYSYYRHMKHELSDERTLLAFCIALSLCSSSKFYIHTHIYDQYLYILKSQCVLHIYLVCYTYKTHIIYIYISCSYSILRCVKNTN